LRAISPLGGETLEAVTTFFLVLVVFATAVDEKGAFKSIAGFGIGSRLRWASSLLVRSRALH